MDAVFATSLGDSVARLTANIVNKLARGDAPPAVAPFVAAANLFAGSKPNSQDVRPLAAGEYVRRLTSRCMCSAAKDEARRVLGPRHIGDALAMGCEIGALTSRAWLARRAGSSGFIALKMDFTNAHNEADRASFLAELRRRLPMLSPWMELTYGCTPHLYVDDDTVPSEQGTQ